jgi:hypothetical protein
MKFSRPWWAYRSYSGSNRFIIFVNWIQHFGIKKTAFEGILNCIKAMLTKTMWKTCRDLYILLVIIFMLICSRTLYIYERHGKYITNNIPCFVSSCYFFRAIITVGVWSIVIVIPIPIAIAIVIALSEAIGIGIAIIAIIVAD